MKKIFTLFTLLMLIILQTSANDGITVELQNNCGKKIALEVALTHHNLAMDIESGVKNKFRLKIGSAIIVNKITIYQVGIGDDGKVIKLCKQ
jgi:hypothetical protein